MEKNLRQALETAKCAHDAVANNGLSHDGGATLGLLIALTESLLNGLETRDNDATTR